jgi:hypothetical protein
MSTNQAVALSNSFGNMLGVVIDRLGYEYQGALPTWMVSIQPESGNSIGFVRAVVLGYLKPGQGKKLLFRYKASLEASGFGLTASMNQYSFVADRYQWDRSLSINYDPSLQKFSRAPSTTFDKIPSIGVVDEGPWSRKISGTTNKLNAIDYGDGEYIAVGENATIISSRGGETWTPVSQIIDLSYNAGVAMSSPAGSTVFNFAYGTNFSLGDQLLSQGAYGSSAASFITDITDYIRLSSPTIGSIPEGTIIEFKRFDGTTFDLWSNVLVANAEYNIVFDSISTVDRGYSLQIKGIDTANVANVTINNTGTNTITLSKPLTNLIPASTRITFDDLTGNVANLITLTTALEGATTLVFSDSTTDVPLHSFARISNIALGTYTRALNTNVTVTESSLSAIEAGRTLYFTSVITSDAFIGDTTINFSSTDKIGIGSAVFGEPVVSSTSLTATWPALSSAGTALTITIPTIDILGPYPFVGMQIDGYLLPDDSTVTAVTTSDDDTLILVEFNSTTVPGNPKYAKTANVNSITGTVNTLLGITSVSNLKLNDYIYSANISIASRVQVTNIFANTKITIGTTDEAHVISAGETVTFQTPASIEFVSLTIVPTGTVVSAKTATSVTLSSPLISDVGIGFDPLIKFGLGEVQLNYVLYTGSSWLAVGTRGLILEKSNNIWSLTYALPYGDLTCIAYNPSTPTWVVVGTEGLVAISNDFETWTPVSTGVTQTFRSIEHHYNADQGTSIFVAVGDAGTIIYSSNDGLTWSIDNTVTTVNIKSVKFINNSWVAVGDQGTVLISVDGISWTSYYSGFKYNLTDVTFINNQYFAIGNKGSILESNDVERWRLRLSSQTTGLTSIANNSRTPVIVGEAGMVLVQADSYTVDWAIRGVSFEMFNYSSLNALARRGYPVEEGDTLIFAQQEGFDPAVHKGDRYLNDGWNNYTEVFDSETSALNYDSAGYDAISVVPGYIENLLDGTVANQRGGVWQVAVNDYGNVYLEFVRPVQLNQVLTIIKESSKLVYDPQIAPGNSVPAYRPLNSTVNTSTNSTTFDVNSTRFSNPRDTYLADPNTYHKYLKFPSTGVLQ